VVLADAALTATLECALVEQRTGWGERRAVVRCQTPRARVDFDPQGLDAAEREAFARIADRGVADLQALVGPVIGQREERRAPVRFVVTARVDVSQTRGRTVLLPLRRVKERRAPYLHEAAHVLLPMRHRSTWLSEGLACYLESWVAENVGGYDAHVFTRAGNRGIHRAAGRIMRTELGRAVLPWVGAPGEPPGLRQDRERVARPFYVLAHSFTKHLVEHLGLPAVLRAGAEADPEGSFQRLSGRSLAQWRAEWLSSAATAARPRSPEHTLG